MAKPKHGGCGGGLISLSLSAAVLLCLLLHPSTALPDITIEDFTVSTLKETKNSSNIIHFDLKLRNTNNEQMYYDALNLTFYYKSNFSNFAIGNATFNRFTQRKFGRDHRVGNIEARGVNWENSTTPVTFRVELKTAVRYDFKVYWKTRRIHLKLGADLKLNDEGSLVKKGVELTYSKSDRNIVGRFEMIGILLGVLFFLQS